jgi:tetratricopeptide (TPR) repeat protein
MTRVPRRAKSRATAPADTITDVGTFRRRVHAKGDLSYSISTYRRQLDPAALPDIVSTLMRNPVYRGAIASDAFPRSYSRIKGRMRMLPASPEIEILWTASILSHYTAELNEFIASRDLYSNQFMGGAYADAGKTLNQIEQKHGLSIWLLAAKIALAQCTDGVAAQKKILDHVVSTPIINPIVAYLIFFFSYSLEDTVQYNEIKRDLGTPVDELDAYFRHHVLTPEIGSISRPADCILQEENSPIIDRFETFMDMAQLLLIRQENISELKLAMNMLANVADQRVSNLRFCLGLNEATITHDLRFTQACDEYTLGNYEQAAESIDASINASPAAAWFYELAARTDTALSRVRSGSCLVQQVIIETQSFLDINKDLNQTQVALQKLSFFTRKLPPSRAISSLLDRVLDPPVIADYTDNQKVWCLTSPLQQPYHYSILLQLLSDRAFNKLLTDVPGAVSITHQLHLACAQRHVDSGHQIEPMDLPQSRKLLYSAYSLYNKDDYAASASYYSAFESSLPKAASPRTAIFHYALLRRLNQIKPALATFTDAFFLNRRSHALYSLGEVVGWAVSQARADDSALDRSILLHIYSTFYDRRYDGDLSDAMEDVLDYYDVSAPSELLSQRIEKKRLIYFLRHVATIDRLEDTTRFMDLDEVEIERIKVLQWLVENDAQQRSAYTQEISSITKDQEVARLSAQFERSKIYVHEEGIRRTFESEIRPAYYRYRQLLADPQISMQTDQIEQRIRKILKDSEVVGYILLPSTERDSGYFSMIQRAYDIFVLDPNHGFKTYLSTRILHGVLEGELRSSFINEGLLVSVDSSGPENEFLKRWSSRLEHLPPPRRAEIAASVVKFSSRVTKAIARLKDDRIRVWDKEHPNGLLKISMTDVAFARLKRSVTPTTTYEEFFDRLAASFWDSTDACLREVKIELHGSFRREIQAAFDSLESSLVSATSDGRASDLLDAIARCRAAFSIDLERISAWFARTGVMPSEPFSASTAIQVAGLITNNCYPRHPLNIMVSGDGSCRLSGKILNPLVDLLTNCFQNAAEHSGFNDRAPSISVSIARKQNRDLAFEIVSEVADHLDVETRRADIAELVLEEEGANASAVAEEGRTGIRKMKRILKHDFQSIQPLSVVLDQGPSVIVRFDVPGRHVDENRTH